MDSDNKFISDDGLPEIYTSPTRRSRQTQENSSNVCKVWDMPILPTVSRPVNIVCNKIISRPRRDVNASNSNISSRFKNCSERVLDCDVVLMNSFHEENISKFHDKSLKYTKTSIQKERKRGETPGSDSPRDFLIALTNLKLDYNFKDDLKRNDIENHSSEEFDIDRIAISKAVTSLNANFNSMIFKSDQSHNCDKSDLLDLSHRRAVEGADSKVILPFIPSLNLKENVDSHIPPSISSSEIELNLLCRKSPAGISTPEIFSNNASTDNECAISILQENILSMRPPVLGHCEAKYNPVAHRKDLGSTDGEDSSNDSTKKSGAQKDPTNIKVLIEPCYVGSQSENTDSNSTVLDMKRLPIQGCENEYKILTGMNNLLEPNFLVGGPISPCIVDSSNTLVDESTTKQRNRPKENGTYTGLVKITSRNSHTEQDDSLISLVSAESTHHPESSECVTPPSVACMSVSSIASSKKLEWDSAADVGYNRKLFEPKESSFPTDSLSTLERIAIGSYAAMMRTEPEGTTNMGCKIKFGNKNKIFLKQKHKSVCKPHSGFDQDNKPLTVNASKIKSNYSTSEDNEDSFGTKKIISYKNLSNKMFNHDKHGSQVSQLKKKSNSSSGMYYSKSGLKKHTCKANSKYTFDTLQSDNDGLEIKNRFLDLKYFQSNKSTSAVSLPYYCISSACGAPTVYSQKSHSLQMLNADNEVMKKNYYSSKEADFDLITHGTSSDNSCKEIQSNNEASTENNLNSLMKSIDGNSSTKSEASYSGKYSNSSSIFNSSSLSLTSINNVLNSFSYKLKEYVLSLKNNGSFSNLNDYDKLQDYIDFVGIPSTNDEEVHLKQSVADIIMRMFSDISKSDDTYIQTLKKEHLSSNAESFISDLESFSCKESKEKYARNPLSFSSKHDKISEELVNKQTAVKCVPYCPSSTSRTYFIVTSEDKEENPGDQSIPGNILREDPNSCLRNFSQNTSHGILDNSPIMISESILQDDLDTALHGMSHKFISIAVNENTSCKGIYQDRHGMLHVAHQPPGYNSNFDSHLSESFSDNDVNKVSNGQGDEFFIDNETLGTLSANEGRRNALAAQSSTGSESAYETIRERHQNIGEALASSFEFYSTSPRDAHVLGCATSDAENHKQVLIQDGSKISEARLCPHTSDVAGISISSNKTTDGEVFSSTESYQQQQFVSRKSQKKSLRKTRPTRKPKARSNIVESDDASSNVSLVQIQRQRYVRRFKNYIHILKKLERNLMPPSLESSLEPKRLMMEPNEASSEESRTCFQNATANSSENIDSSLQISSEDHSSTSKFSYDGVDKSLIIHRTCSATLMNNSDSSSIGKLKVNVANNSISSNVQSSESSPEHTLTLCQEKKIKKSKNTSHNYNVDSDLKSCGKISDFRKLMASTSAPGEMRPYRYLLQKDNCKDREVRQNKISENNFISKEIELMRINMNLKISDEALKDASAIEGNHSSKSCAVTYGIFEQGMVDEMHKVEKNATNIPESEEAEMQKINDSYNCQLNVISKETQDFGQMYPSSSSLQIDDEAIEISKISQAVGTQTEEAEVSTDIVDKPVVLLSTVLTKDHNKPLAIEDHSLKKLDGLVAVDQDRCHISLLEQMEEKIKNNTHKINLALEDYNKQFGPLLTSEKVTNKVSEPKLQLLPKQKYAAKLNLQNEIPELNYQHFLSQKNSEMSICGNIIDSKIEKPLESFATAENGLKFVVKVDSKLRSRESLNKSLAEELIELNKEKEIMTLQEALALARPGYIKEAEKRRIKIRRKQTLRRELQEHNQSVLARLSDNLKTPTVLRKFLYQPDESPLFNYKTMREQNKRLYQMLPEAQKPVIMQKNESKSKVRRLMASYYSQKLKGKVLSGKVSHSHRHIVTPIR